MSKFFAARLFEYRCHSAGVREPHDQSALVESAISWSWPTRYSVETLKHRHRQSVNNRRRVYCCNKYLLAAHRPLSHYHYVRTVKHRWQWSRKMLKKEAIGRQSERCSQLLVCSGAAELTQQQMLLTHSHTPASNYFRNTINNDVYLLILLVLRCTVANGRFLATTLNHRHEQGTP